jgi:outer membrane protein OmpA-like peptidoglycan-associated protein
MRQSFVSIFILLVTALPAAAQGNWQQPKEFQKPRDVWQVPGEIQKPRDVWQTPGEFQKPGEIQVPKGIQAIKPIESGACERRLSVVGDALFDFDKAGLRADAEETLAAALPEIGKLGGKPARIEGHTDAIGSDSYNQKLSEARATTVRDWLAQRGAIPPGTAITGYGKTKPVAANATEDGKDYPEGRQKNRRVEVVFDICR